MVSTLKVVSVLSGGVVQCLSLSNASQALEGVGPDPCAERKGGQPNLLRCSEETRQGIETIKGEVLRVDGDHFIVQRFDGKEVALRIEPTTHQNVAIQPGARIEAKVHNVKDVNEVRDQRRVLSIRQLEK
jgi:hypothetical protein